MISSSNTISASASRVETLVSVLVHSNAKRVIASATTSPISTKRSFLFSRFAFSDFLISISVVNFYILVLPGKVRNYIFYFKLFIHFVALQKIISYDFLLF